MKNSYILKCKCLRTVFLSLSFFLFLRGQSQPDYDFGTGTLESGTYKALNSVYRYSNVKPGIDGLVTIQAIVDATIDSVDRNGIGHVCAFQPSIYINANKAGYIEFEIRFVLAGTNTPVSQALINVTSIDIDGSGPLVDPNYIIYEFDEYNFPGGAQIDYSTTGGQLFFTTAGSWVRGKNIGGNEYPDIDTVAKEVMFTMLAQNQSSFRVRMGADNQNPDDRYRLRSLYFKKFTYPYSVLPVKLISFTALFKNNKADLEWTTSGENNTAYFVVEKSFNGTNYDPAGIVFARGNTGDKINYSFSDDLTNIQPGIVYYRLRSVDNDGKGQHSGVRIIRVSKQAGYNLAIVAYPNPVTEELRITIPSGWQGKNVTYELFNANGQTMSKRESTNSSQTETLNVNSLAPGAYIIRVTCKGETAQQKIIKL